MSEQIQRWRGIMLLIAAGLAGIAVLANVAHSGKIAWGGLVILVIAFVAWRSSRSSPA
jgi:hypothetical protein